jgi:autophagy-related protein 17
VFCQQTECEEQLTGLEQHLSTLEHLHQQFQSYQTSFSKLILELARRRQYREAAENIVKGMMTQLEAMTDGETSTWLSYMAKRCSCFCLVRGKPSQEMF